MAWPARVGVALTFPHPVRDVSFNPVSGQAANVTQSLIGPTRAAASEVATLADMAVAGWVAVTITLLQGGVYTITLTNPAPPTADGAIVDYDIDVSVGLAASSGLLTSLDRVRTRLQLTDTDATPIEPGDAHVLDSLINLLISEVSDEYQGDLGRTFAEQAYTEYLDGSGTSSLVLGAGPLVSVTSLQSVVYNDDDAGGVAEVPTTIAPHTYVTAGLRTQPRYRGLGRIDYLGATRFQLGARRYKVVYTAGFDPLPEQIVGLATTDVVFRLMSREQPHLISQSIGDGSVSYLGPLRMEEARRELLAPYRLERVA